MLLSHQLFKVKMLSLGSGQNPFSLKWRPSWFPACEPACRGVCWPCSWLSLPPQSHHRFPVSSADVEILIETNLSMMIAKTIIPRKIPCCRGACLTGFQSSYGFHRNKPKSFLSCNPGGLHRPEKYVRNRQSAAAAERAAFVVRQAVPAWPHALESSVRFPTLTKETHLPQMFYLTCHCAFNRPVSQRVKSGPLFYTGHAASRRGGLCRSTCHRFLITDLSVS